MRMDFTQNKKMDTALRASELRYRRLFESARDGILILDAKTGIVIDVNPYLIEMLNMSREDFLGMKVWELGFFKDIVANEAKLLELQQKKYIRYDNMALEGHDGKRHEVEFVSNVYLEDNYPVIQCNIRDISERKRAEQELIESKALLEAVVENIPLMLFLKEAEELRFVIFNRAGEELLGYDRTALLGNNNLDLFPPEQAAHFMAKDREVLDGETGIMDIPEELIETAKGEQRLLHTRKVCIKGSDGKTKYLLGISEDITERKQADALRISLEEQLRLQQRLETVGQLAAGVAHDFNNILTGITGFTQFALDSLPAAGASRKDLTEVLTLAKRAAELTSQLLAFSRRQPLQPNVLNINDVISNLANMLGRLLGEHIKIKFELADDLGAVKVDPGQFEQVLMNLAVNARDAMPDGGILTIGTSNAELDEEYARMHVGVTPGQYVSLTVSDSGCGIKPELLNHVFEPFFTTKEIGKGTGLGLATVYGIVKQHGGNIWVYSEPEHGTAFKTYLPRVMDEISAVATAEPSNTCTGTETILIVEDDPFVLKVAQGILTSFGYHILSATLPSQAEIVLAEHGDTIALMLTDILMPERNGHQLYESVHARFPRMRVLYMSGYPADVIDNQGVLDSNAAFISKPFTANALGRKVRDILDA